MTVLADEQNAVGLVEHKHGDRTRVRHELAGELLVAEAEPLSDDVPDGAAEHDARFEDRVLSDLVSKRPGFGDVGHCWTWSTACTVSTSCTFSSTSTRRPER
ncbi:hypothetical protein ACFPRL_05615 [Pseudoclavibacter helvolus]